LEEEIKDIADENIKSIELNSRVGASFFLQKQYEAAIPYLEKAKKTIQSSNLSKEKEPPPPTKRVQQMGVVLGGGRFGVRTWKFFIVWLFGWFQYGTRVGDCILPLK